MRVTHPVQVKNEARRLYQETTKSFDGIVNDIGRRQLLQEGIPGFLPGQKLGPPDRSTIWRWSKKEGWRKGSGLDPMERWGVRYPLWHLALTWGTRRMYERLKELVDKHQDEILSEKFQQELISDEPSMHNARLVEIGYLAALPYIEETIDPGEDIIYDLTSELLKRGHSYLQSLIIGRDVKMEILYEGMPHEVTKFETEEGR